MDNRFLHIKNIAIKYFNGAASADEEKDLYAFISNSSHHRSLFKTWENEWNADKLNTNFLMSEWEQLNHKIELHESVDSILPMKRYQQKFIAITVAASLFIGIMIPIIFYYSKSEIPLKTYCIEAPCGQKSKITLSDGSVVWINSGTKLTYDSDFGIKNRTVTLVGEAFFDVRKSSKPFIVTTPEYSVEVKGTKFNVTAYSNDSFSSTSLLTGQISLSYANTLFKMVPGETMIVEKNTGKIVKSNHSSTQSISWLKNKIEFDDIRLDELVKRLSRTYNKKIILKNQQLKEKLFSVSIKNEQSIDEVLKALTDIVPMKIIKTNDTIQLM